MNPPLACAGNSILVTGAGGYIGSALVKAIAASAPQSVTLLDLSEHNIYELKRGLDADFPALRYQAVVGSVQNSTLIGSLFVDFAKTPDFPCRRLQTRRTDGAKSFRRPHE